jgi:spore germination protein KB
MFVVLALFILTVIYILSLGLEVLARLSELMLPVFLLLGILLYVLIAASGEVDFSQLKPVLSEGMKPVISAAFPSVVNFPFGEIAVFLMFLNLVDYKPKTRIISFIALGASGLMIMLSTIMMISVLGVDYVSNSTFPLYDMMKIINVMEIFTNLDVIVGIWMFIGGIFKMSLYFYAGILAFKSLFNTTNERWLIVLAGISVTWFTLAFYKNFPFQNWSGEMIMNRYIHNMFQIIFPSIILMIVWLRSRVKNL